MKIFYMIIVFMFMVSVSCAGENTEIKIDQDDSNPVIIITRNNKIKVWPCGKVAKQIWDTLNENEDSVGTADIIMNDSTYILTSDVWEVTD